VVVLYPEAKVSEVQDAQFSTLGGNVTADCRRRDVRRLPAARQGSLRRSGIAVARAAHVGELDQPRRLIPQMFYYAYAASQSSADKQLTISVPSGNFGNLVAG
jgi:threonine synthase